VKGENEGKWESPRGGLGLEGEGGQRVHCTDIKQSIFDLVTGCVCVCVSKRLFRSYRVISVCVCVCMVI
jgi:hypothetical protein